MALESPKRESTNLRKTQGVRILALVWLNLTPLRDVLGHLVSSWGHLGSIVGRFWAVMVSPWPILGPSCGHPGAILGQSCVFPGALDHQKLRFSIGLATFCNWAIFPSTSTILPYLAPSRLLLGPSWGHLGTLLDPHGAQDGCKVAPKWIRMAPRRLHERAKSDQIGPRWAHHGPRQLQGDP